MNKPCRQGSSFAFDLVPPAHAHQQQIPCSKQVLLSIRRAVNARGAKLASLIVERSRHGREKERRKFRIALIDNDVGKPGGARCAVRISLVPAPAGASSFMPDRHLPPAFNSECMRGR